MATLKEVAERANVPMLTAFHALKNGDVDHEIRQLVFKCADELHYKLKITQIDVADLANVAKGTVSYALNNSDLIKESTRQKVRDAAEALGYRPNTVARNLRKNQTGVIGYSWHVADDPSMMNNLLDRFIYRVTAAAEEMGFHILTFIQPKMNADEVYDDLISTNRVDGFILSDVLYNDSRISRLSNIGAPFVAFGGMFVENADFAYVDVDSWKGIELAVNHLLAQGHERIGMLNYDRGWPVGQAREAGYRETLERAGIEVQPDWIVHTPNILRAAASATEHIMKARKTPTAIVCANDIMAFGAKTYFDEVGLRMGGDVALTGYDDDPTSEFLGITSVRQPIDQVATAVFDLLYHEINEQPLPNKQVVLEPSLTVRHSTVG